MVDLAVLSPVPIPVVRLSSLEPSRVGSGLVQSCHLSVVSFESVLASGRIAVLYTFVLESAHTVKTRVPVGKERAHIHPSFVKIEAIGLGTVVGDISKGIDRLLLLPSYFVSRA